MLSALGEFSLAAAARTIDELALVLRDLDAVKGSLATEEVAAIDLLEDLFRAFQCLCRWAVGRRSGEADSGRHLEAAKELALVAEEKLPTLSYPRLRDAGAAAATAIKEVSGTTALAAVGGLLARIPVPPFLIVSRNPFGGQGREVVEAEEVTPEGPFVVRVMLTVDGRPWSDPQLLRAGSMYDVGLKVVVLAWPTGSDHLVLDFVTTLPEGCCNISPFQISRPEQPSAEEHERIGNIVFPVGQSLLSEPALLQMRATFLSTSDRGFTKSASVIGYHKLRARVSDPTRTPLLSRYRSLDARIEEIVDQVRGLRGVSEQHLADFIEALGAVTNYMGICAQQALYRAGQNILERDFQRDLLIHLRRQLGEDVQEAPRQAGGITDVRFRSVTIELKVEERVANRQEMLRGYQNQPTQYTSGTGAQLGILCVLDLTEKDLPPAPTQNNIQLLEPALHGFAAGEAPFPVRIAAVIVDGNLRSPSSYSR